MKKYVIFEAPESPLPEGETPLSFAEGTAIECVRILLLACSEDDLNRLKLSGIHAAQKVLLRRKELAATATRNAAISQAREDDEPPEEDATPLASEGPSC